MVDVHRGRARRVTRYPVGVLPMTAVPDSGPDTPPAPDPYIGTVYWAAGEYGYIRRGDFLVINQGTRDDFQNLPSEIYLPEVPNAHHLALYLDIFEIFGFYNVFERKEARILVEGVVWKDWFAYETTQVNAGNAPSWPPPPGRATVDLRAVFHPPAGAPNQFDYRWNEVRLLRYEITIYTPNPLA